MIATNNSTATDWRSIAEALVIITSSIGAMASCTYSAALLSTYLCAQLAGQIPQWCSRHLTPARGEG